MKKLIVASVALGMFSTPAFAQQSQESESFSINGTVVPQCTMEAPTDVDFNEFDVVLTPGATALNFDDGDSTDTQQIWMSCNAPASITVQSANGGLVGSNAPTDPQFTNVLNHAVSLTTNTGTALVGPINSYKAGLHGTNARSLTVNNEFHTLADLNVRVERGDQGNAGKKLVAGDYTDTMTITIAII